MSSNQTAIKITGVSKLFFKQEQKTFKEFLPAFFMGKKTREWFWALQDINLDIKRGESVGIMGPNGSGKSTLLKLIAGVSQPTKGTITTKGRLAPLIELGAGFHPELTGRENVYLNGVILGMSRSEVESKFKAIVNFAELWDFIDIPVKHYSSGMYLRLAFSVAIHTGPDILLIDEILAVGDASFQKKCFAKLQELHTQEVTLLIVSHNQPLLHKMTKRIIQLDHGMI
ncbi:MAG: ABC transporter ATP-binding protein [bacterium]